MTVQEFIIQWGFQVDESQLENLARDIDRVQRHAQHAGASLGAMAEKVKGLASAAVGLVSGGLLGYIIQQNAEFERLHASLETVTGSTKAADDAFKVIQKFAAKTPYDLGQVVEAFTKLKALGLEPSEEALTAYGNTASSMGKPLMQMIEAVADAATGEFERLKEFGIKAKQQGNQVSFTFKGVTTTVKKESRAIEAYLKNIGLKDFAGAMDRQSRTLNGLMSNLGDNVSRLARSVGAGGLMSALEETASGLNDFTSSGDDAAKSIGKALGDAVRTTTRWVKDLYTQGRELVDRLGGIGNVGRIAAGVIGGVLLLNLGKAAMAFRALGNAALMAELKALAVPLAIGAAIALAALAIQDLWTYFHGGDSVTGDLLKKFPQMKPVIDAIGDAVQRLSPAFNALWGVVMGLVNGVIAALPTLIPIFATVFGGALQVVLAFCLFAINRFINLWTFIGTVVGAVAALLVNLWENPSNALAAFGIFFEQVFGGLWQLVVSTLANVLAFAGQVIGVDLVGVFGQMEDAVGAVWDSIVNIVRQSITQILMEAKKLPFLGGLADMGINLVNGGALGGVTPGATASGRAAAGAAGGGETHITNQVSVTVPPGTTNPTAIGRHTAGAVGATTRGTLATAARMKPRPVR